MVIKNFTRKFLCCLRYIRQGIFLKKIRDHLQDFNRQKRNAWWNSNIGFKKYFDTRIEHNIIMRLYFDSKLDQLIFCEDFERNERKFLENFLRTGDIFIDIGANIGLFSLIASPRIGKEGKIYAIEPTGKIYKRLCENVKLNHFNNIYCFQLALSDQQDILPFYISQTGYDAWNSLAPPNSKDLFNQEFVKCEKWDDFALENDLIGNVTMMKIDVEGWETHLLSGGFETLSRQDAPVLQVEFSDEAAQAAGSSCVRLYHLLENLGFQMFIYDAKLRTLIHDPIRANYSYLNLIAAKEPQKIFDRLNRAPVRFSWPLR
jgi:FkbM family methyltransferase